MMNEKLKPVTHDFKGIGYSKIGHFKEMRTKIKELETLSIKLAKRHNRLEAILNSMSDGLTILDRNLNAVYSNQVQKKIFPKMSGYGKKCHQILHGKSKTCRNCPALKTLETRQTLRGETVFDDSDLAGRYFEWATSPIVDSNGDVNEIVLLMRDVTERKDFEFQLIQADRMAAIGFLSAGIAHEINNPLTSIAGFSEGLLNRIKKMSGGQDDEQLPFFREYLKIINEEAYRCKETIRNLQEFSRGSSNDFEAISIDEVIEDTISLIRQHAKDKRIIIRFQNDIKNGNNKLFGKETQLKHLFLKLFNNAFNAIEKEGRLSIMARSDGKEIEVAISDSGDRYPDEMSWKSICMAANSTKEEEHMLDLSICYNIVQHHKGEMKFSDLGAQGKVTMIKFPLIQPQSEPADNA